VTFPPGSVFADPSFDAEAAQEEALLRRNSSPFPHCSGPFVNSDSPLAMQRWS
jgi:hypothetical protein